MRKTFFIAWLIACSALGQDISLTNRIATFTNLQGTVYKNVQLVRGDLDGVIWRNDGGGGRVCYTNLHPDILLWLGIPTNRIALAKARAEHKSVADANYKAKLAARDATDARAKAEAQAEWDAGAPAREREAQRQAMLAAIESLQAQIEFAERKVRYADAVTPTGATGDPDYVNAVMAQRSNVNLAAEQVNDARIRLNKLLNEYKLQFGGKN
jgi:hypothetical protein